MKTLPPRWKKALRDLWLNKTRTLLVVAAMAIGIFGLGLVADAYAILTREMDVNYMRTQPASATLWTNPLDDLTLQTVRDRPEIAQAEARRMVTGRIQTGPDEWYSIWLFTARDFNDVRLDQFTPDTGAWPPTKGEILIERAAVGLIGAQIGQTRAVKIAGGPVTDLKLTGTVHAPGLAPAWMERIAYGYVTLDTLQMLGAAPELNELKISVAQNEMDPGYIRGVTYQLKDWLEQNGQKVYRIEIPAPGKHPHASQMATLLFLLEAFGLLAFVLSGVLVANMISALLAQQIRQIGVMKAVGAGMGQIMGIYIGTVLFLGGLALIIAVPLALWVGQGYAGFAAGMLNFTIFSADVPHGYFLLQIGLGLLVPVLVALYPIYRGSRVSVAEAIRDYGVGQGTFGRSAIDRWLGQIRGLSSPLRLSLRNTFRQRSRFLLTLGTLAMGGAIFITATNVLAAMNTTVASKFNAIRYDVQIRLSQAYPVEQIVQAANAVPGVAQVEAWGGAKMARVYADGTTGNGFDLLAPPQTTRLMTALPLIAGRWLQAGDQNALVINQMVLEKEPDLKVGDKIVLRTGAQESQWQIVGIVQEIMSPPAAYANNEGLAIATGQVGKAQNLIVAAQNRDTSAVTALTGALERQVEIAGLDVAATWKLATLRKAIEEHLVLMVSFLIFMSLLIVLVGGLGLASTMSINVLERTREIGVMRATGAGTHDVIRIVVGEGTLIGLLSWLIAVILAVPVSAYLSYTFGMVFFDAPLEFAISPLGCALWLGIAAGFAALASLYPAWNAASLPVREVLAYE
jgi:putative ABC transport system permease protein